jgi:predicted RNA-binding Zn-ribbon protein involved in translation (DUF1610 family)
MPQIKHARKYGRATNLLMVTLGVGWVALGSLVMIVFAPESLERWILIGAIFMLIALVMGMIVYKKMRNFVCPDCHTPIMRPLSTKGRPEAEIQFYCEKCDVTWNTGLYTAE